MTLARFLSICAAGCFAVSLAYAATSTATGLFGLAVAADEDAAPSIYDFTMNDIDGEPVDLRDFEGSVLLVVNTASKCGNTPQYTALEAMYQEHKEDGFAVLAFPANEFGGQEPGTDAEIKEFCTLTDYAVTFPIFSKIVVKGEGQHPLYDYLTHKLPNEKLRGEIDWNFAKFLVARDGTVLARYKAKVKPDDRKLVKQLAKALEAPRPEKADDADENGHDDHNSGS
jgi:glutathione peroxidase